MRRPKVASVLRLVKEFGFRVFPVAMNTKLPLVKWQSNYVTGEEEFENFRKEFKKCNWGINCGKSRLIVIDLDVGGDKDGPGALQELLDTLGVSLPETFTVRTHSGGIHLYFWGACASSNGKLGKGIDIKSVGGFVVAPGGVGKHGYYVIEKDVPIAEIPDWFVSLANQPGRKDPNRHIDAVELDQDYNIMWASDYLLSSADIAAEGSGGNDTTFREACAVRDLGVSQDMTFHLMENLWNDRCKPPWDPAELQQIVANAYAYAQDAAGAKAIELNFEPVTEIDSTLEGILTKEEKVELEMASTNDYDYLSIVCGAKDFQQYNFPKKDMLMDPWLQLPSYILLTGDRGVGKTWFSLSVAFAIAAGRNFGPWDVLKSVPVLYFEAEMAGVDQQDRIKQLCRGEEPPDNFYFLSGAMLHEKKKKPFNLNDPKCRKALATVLVKMGIKFWVLDNIASTSPGTDENDKAAWDDINQWCLYLRHLGIITILVHHNNKQGVQRGTSGREDNTDLQVALKLPLGYKIEDGACFDVTFNKTRQFNRSQLQRMVGYRFQLNEGIYADWTWTQPNSDARLEILLLLAQGLSNKEINESTGIAKSTITNALKYGKRNGWFSRAGNLTQPGRDYFAPYLTSSEEEEANVPQENDDLFD